MRKIKAAVQQDMSMRIMNNVTNKCILELLLCIKFNK